MRKTSNNLQLILLIIGGIIVGSFISYLLSPFPYMSWIGYSKNFGHLDLALFTLQFIVDFNISIGSLIGVIIAIVIYRKF